MLFYTILWLTILGSIINTVFFGQAARKNSPLGVALYRWISLSLLLSPLLFFADFSSISSDFILISWVFWVIGAVGLVIQLKSYQYLPIWIVRALLNLYNIGIIILSYLFLGETLSFWGYAGAIILLISLLVLGSIKSKQDHLDPNYARWIFLVFLRVITFTVWVFGFVYFAREVDPYMSIWLSEFSVLLGLLLLVPFYKNKEDIFYAMTTQQAWKFLLSSSLPAFFSFGLFYAATIGNPSVVTLTLSTSSIFIALVSHWFYHEKLNMLQWLMIVVSVWGLIMINL